MGLDLDMAKTTRPRSNLRQVRRPIQQCWSIEDYKTGHVELHVIDEGGLHWLRSFPDNKADHVAGADGKLRRMDHIRDVEALWQATGWRVIAGEYKATKQ